MDIEFNKGWEHEPKDRPLFINLHKLMFRTNNDYANQVSIIFMHIFLGLINHVVMEAYNEYWGTNVHSAHSIVIYHPTDPNHFKELDYILQNTCVNYKQIRTL